MLINKETDTQALVSLIKARGWQDASRTLLDVLEPIAPLVSQFLWVVQPLSSVIEAQDFVGNLAKTLDSPDGIDDLRKQLDEQ